MKKRTKTVVKKARRKAIQEFWAVFSYGGFLTICSRHRSTNAARRSARKCEHRGGASHRILYVEEV